jgi:hypothetical protein
MAEVEHLIQLSCNSVLLVSSYDRGSFLVEIFVLGAWHFQALAYIWVTGYQRLFNCVSMAFQRSFFFRMEKKEKYKNNNHILHDIFFFTEETMCIEFTKSSNQAIQEKKRKFCRHMDNIIDRTGK